MRIDSDVFLPGKTPAETGIGHTPASAVGSQSVYRRIGAVVEPTTVTNFFIIGIFAHDKSKCLFANAAYAGKKALTLLTVSDSLVTNEETTAEEREKTFTAMMEVALEIA